MPDGVMARETVGRQPRIAAVGPALKRMHPAAIGCGGRIGPFPGQ